MGHIIGRNLVTRYWCSICWYVSAKHGCWLMELLVYLGESWLFVNGHVGVSAKPGCGWWTVWSVYETWLSVHVNVDFLSENLLVDENVGPSLWSPAVDWWKCWSVLRNRVVGWWTCWSVSAKPGCWLMEMLVCLLETWLFVDGNVGLSPRNLVVGWWICWSVSAKPGWWFMVDGIVCLTHCPRSVHYYEVVLFVSIGFIVYINNRNSIQSWYLAGWKRFRY